VYHDGVFYGYVRGEILKSTNGCDFSVVATPTLSRRFRATFGVLSDELFFLLGGCDSNGIVLAETVLISEKALSSSEIILGPWQPRTDAMVAIAEEGSVMYMAAGKGTRSRLGDLWRSGDQGKTWKILMNGPFEVHSISALKSSVCILSSIGLQVSLDKGDNWRFVPLPDIPTGGQILIDSEGDSYDRFAFYLFTYRGLFCTSDGGETWYLKSMTLGSPHFFRYFRGETGPIAIAKSGEAILQAQADEESRKIHACVILSIGRGLESRIPFDLWRSIILPLLI
jgi:hypothetical protein